ncbi:hypothetical protein TorRG33x02_111490 [Trema orientale]|uniref:Uncharacterized protein n=1 Tax=Trema orientale TaxID=63057 RepID=A0A2P5F621_TREOI|nr:hypothetical protein TorRG33x02_111490 [Trema orientale]
MGEERYRVIPKEQDEYYMAPKEDSSVPIMFEEIVQRPDQDQDQQQDFVADDHHSQKPSSVAQKGPYKQGSNYITHHQVPQQESSHMAPPRELMNLFEQSGKRYPHTTAVRQEQHKFPPAETERGQHKKSAGPAVLDCSEAAKRYGGVLLNEYGRNKNFPHRDVVPDYGRKNKFPPKLNW